MGDSIKIIQQFHFEMIGHLIAINLERRKLLSPETVDALSDMSYAKEYGTVALNIGRQVGKDWYIQKI